MNTPDFRALCAELVDWVERASDLHRYGTQDLITRARAALAEPELPADGEVAELVAALRNETQGFHSRHRILGNLTVAQFTRAATLLAQLSDLAADAVAGLRYIERSHGLLYGVGWDRVYAKADALKPQHSAPALAESGPVGGPTSQELLHAWENCRTAEPDPSFPKPIIFARAVLARWGRR
jgi:hypothetical protein